MIKIKDRLNEKSLECSKIKEIHNEEMEDQEKNISQLEAEVIAMKDKAVYVTRKYAFAGWVLSEVGKLNENFLKVLDMCKINYKQDDSKFLN